MSNSKPNILIIDDEQQILLSFKAHFRQYYNVFTANNTVEAQELLDSHDIHVILCDYNMPGKDGVLFFSEVLITHPLISRILITAHEGLQVAMDAINIGSIYRYVSKPWNLEELKVIIDQSYNFYKLKQENEFLMERLLSNDRLIRLLEERKED